MSLIEILNAREERWRKKCALASEKQGCVVSLTLRMPASLRMTEEGKAFLWHAASEAERAFSKDGLIPERICALDGADGPCVLWRVKDEADKIKLASIAFEEETAEGEICDLDVMTEEGEELSRQAFQKPYRRCVVCQRINARECILEKRHSAEETEKAIRDKLKRFL